jgi:hypothetical protein
MRLFELTMLRRAPTVNPEPTPHAERLVHLPEDQHEPSDGSMLPGE